MKMVSEQMCLFGMLQKKEEKIVRREEEESL